VQVRAGELEVSSQRVCTVGRLRAGRYARVQVIDSGVGMTAAQIERIFDPFFTTKPVGEGTGLGLSLVHGIVLDHDAALEVDSRSAVGTTFSLYLPLAEGQPAPPPVPSAAPSGAGQTILVVDDEESLVHLAEEVLASLGYEPVGCVGANEALKVFRAQPDRFDAIVSDAIMPDLPGTKLIAEVRRLRPDLPAILMSGYGGPDLQAQAAAAGVHAVLSKPLRAVELAKSLAGVLRNGPVAADAPVGAP
jgi:CheY-like chemotaxis protein